MRKESVEKLVIAEINKFRRISGLPLLNEGGKSDIARGAIRMIDDAFGVTSKPPNKLASEVGDDAARLLKKLVDPNDTTPIIGIIDDLMSVNKTVGRNVYTQLRNHLDTIVDSTGKSLRDKLNKISANSKKMIQDGYTVDEAAEYFETEMKRILDDSTTDGDLVSAISKYEKDFNREWFPSSANKKNIRNKVDDSVNIKKVLLSDTEIKELNKVVQSKTVKTFAYDTIRYWKASVQDIQKEIQGISEGFIESIKGAKKKDKQRLINAYGAKISRLLDRAEIKQNGAAAKILQDSGVDKELVYKIKHAKEPFFEVYRNARGINNETLAQIMVQTSKEFIVEIWDLIIGLFRKEGNTLIRMFDWRTSVGQWFITNQWASINKLYRLAIKISPGESKTKLLKYLGATMFASSVGFVIGQLLKSGLQGLNDLYGVLLRNKLIDAFAGEDGMIFGIDVGQYKKDLPEFGRATNILDELGKPLDAIGQRIFDDVIESYNKKGLKDVILRAAPGGVLTYPESFLVQTYERITPGEGNVPNLRNPILRMLGYDPDELERTIQELEGNIPTLELTVDAVKEAAPDDIKQSIWEKDGEILIGSYREEQDRNGNIVQVRVDYKVSVENNEYVVDIGTRKIKLNDY
jgi:hypothetical protein